MDSPQASSHGDSAEGSTQDATLTDKLWQSYNNGVDRDLSDSPDIQSVRRERDFWKEMFNQLIVDFPEGVLVTANDGTLTHWNSALADALHISPSEALGEHAYDVIGTENKEETLAETITRTEQVIKEDEIREVPTTDVIFQNYGIPLRAPDGTVVGAFEVATDVSSHIKRQRELESIQASVSGSVREQLTELSDSIDEFILFSDEVEAFASKEAAKMEEAAGEVSNQSATVEEIASTAEEVDELGQRAHRYANNGEDAAEAAIDRLEGIQRLAGDVSSTIEDLRQQADEMDTIIEIIQEISDQTNMLALNASIEAARVDEAGDGFGIVAEEIKSLADESHKQSAEIEKMVADIESITEQTATELDETVEEIETAIDAVEETVTSFHRVRESVTETANGAQEVAAATDDHAESSEEVAAMIDETVSNLEQLKEQITDLNEVATDQYQQVEKIEETVDSLV